MITRDRSKATKRFGSNFTFAIALACGTALMTGAIASPAEAQRSKKKKKEKAPKQDYSPAFVEAYKPVEDTTKGLVPDVDGARALIPAMLAAATTPDDKLAAGRMLAVIGGKADDISMQRQGYELMLSSGKASPEEKPNFLYNSGQLAYAEEDYPVALERIQAAAEAGFAVQDLEHTISGLYFLQDRYDEGLAYLRGAVDTAIGNGDAPSEKLLTRGFSAAYNNDMQDEALEWTAMQVRYYPTDANWVNVIALRREYFDEDQGMILDLLRLQDKTAGLKNDRDYINYIESSNARFPAEMKRVVDQGLAAGALRPDSVFVQEAKQNIDERVAEVREDMPGLERDARAASSNARIATAAADVLLSLGNYEQAAEVYSIAATRPGVDADVVHTRMGIALAGQGKGSEAKASLAKVTGKYKYVADLWTAYADQLPTPAAAAAAPVAETVESTT